MSGRIVNRRSLLVIIGIFLVVIIGAAWFWFTSSYWKDRAFVTNANSATLKNGVVEIGCRRDSDCVLVNPSQDYRGCTHDLVCPDLSKQNLAVNLMSFQELGQRLNFVDEQSCRQQLGIGTRAPDCPGGLTAYAAKCIRRHCVAVGGL